MTKVYAFDAFQAPDAARLHGRPEPGKKPQAFALLLLGGGGAQLA
jgi:hypothetical protein